jgi:hypothetical protein
MQKKDEDISYVKVDNANMIKLSLTKLGKLYADYAHLILNIKKLNDQKKDLRKQLSEKMVDLETKYNAFVKELPKIPEGLKIKSPDYPGSKAKEVEYRYSDPLEGLRQEFENIRSELEKLR